MTPVAAQLELFAASRRLVDVPIDQRLAGALDVLADEELDVTERLELLALVAWPAAFATEVDG